MTTQEIRDEAIRVAIHVRETHGVPHAGCDADVTFDECDRTECTLARYILSLHDETPVDRAAFAESLACVSYILDNRWQLSTAGQLRMLKAVVGV